MDSPSQRRQCSAVEMGSEGSGINRQDCEDIFPEVSDNNSPNQEAERVFVEMMGSDGEESNIRYQEAERDFAEEDMAPTQWQYVVEQMENFSMDVASMMEQIRAVREYCGSSIQEAKMSEQARHEEIIAIVEQEVSEREACVKDLSSEGGRVSSLERALQNLEARVQPLLEAKVPHTSEACFMGFSTEDDRVGSLERSLQSLEVHVQTLLEAKVQQDAPGSEVSSAESCSIEATALLERGLLNVAEHEAKLNDMSIKIDSMATFGNDLQDLESRVQSLQSVASRGDDQIPNLEELHRHIGKIAKFETDVQDLEAKVQGLMAWQPTRGAKGKEAPGDAADGLSKISKADDDSEYLESRVQSWHDAATALQVAEHEAKFGDLYAQVEKIDSVESSVQDLAAHVQNLQSAMIENNGADLQAGIRDLSSKVDRMLDAEGALQDLEAHVQGLREDSGKERVAMVELAEACEQRFQDFEHKFGSHLQVRGGGAVDGAEFRKASESDETPLPSASTVLGSVESQKYTDMGMSQIDEEAVEEGDDNEQAPEAHQDVPPPTRAQAVQQKIHEQEKTLEMLMGRIEAKTSDKKPPGGQPQQEPQAAPVGHGMAEVPVAAMVPSHIVAPQVPMGMVATAMRCVSPPGRPSMVTHCVMLPSPQRPGVAKASRTGSLNHTLSASGFTARSASPPQRLGTARAISVPSGVQCAGLWQPPPPPPQKNSPGQTMRQTTGPEMSPGSTPRTKPPPPKMGCVMPPPMVGAMMSWSPPHGCMAAVPHRPHQPPAGSLQPPPMPCPAASQPTRNPNLSSQRGPQPGAA